MPAPTPSVSFLASVRRALYAAGLVERRVVVACSGGPDSTALVLCLAALQGELALSLHVVYVDHGLREAAALQIEAQAVLELAQGLDLPAEVVPLPSPIPQGPSLMAAARERRYQALADAARRTGAVAIATGHTASDQAETLLMRLLHGAALRGLSAMPPVRTLPGSTNAHPEPLLLVRPLLDLSRTQILSFLDDSGVSPLTDPTNTDRRFLRARLRDSIVPLLRLERPDFDQHASALCDQLRADASFLDSLADQALARLTTSRPPGSLPAAELAALPLPLASRVVLRTFGPLPHRLVLAVLDLCRSTHGTNTLDLPDRRRAERRYGDLLLTSQIPPAQGPQAPVLIPGPGTYHLGDTAISLSLVPLADAPKTDPGTIACFDPQMIPFPLTLRTPLPGDRLRLRGAKTRKVSDLLIDAKVPRTARHRVTLLAHGDDILWIVGLRLADTAPPAGPQVLVAQTHSPGLTGRGRMQ